MKKIIFSILAGVSLLSTSPCIAEKTTPLLPSNWRPILDNQRIFWAGARNPSRNDLVELRDLMPRRSQPTLKTATIEKFVQDNPASGWAPALQSVLASRYAQRGQFTKALALWETAWNQTKNLGDGEEGKHVADVILANWTRVLASLGRFNTLTTIFKETKGRVLDRGPLSQKFLRTKEAYAIMKKRPGISYRCGTMALANVCYSLYGTNFDVKALAAFQSTTNGFTLHDLDSISKELNLKLVAVRRSDSAPLIVPSVINWKQHHYGAIVEQKGDRYKVIDPTTGYPRYMTADEIKAEATGYFLIPSSRVDRESVRITSTEARNVYGKGNPWFLGDGDDQPCPTCPCPIGPGPGPGPGPGSGPGPGPGSGSGSGPMSCQSCSIATFGSNLPTGMARWGVSEPYVNLWLQDEPLGYQPAYGPRVSLELYYRTRSEYSSPIAYEWTCPWTEYVEYDGEHQYALLHLPGGGYSVFTNIDVGSSNYYNNDFLVGITNVDGDYTNYELDLPDGSKEIFAQQSAFLPYSVPSLLYLTRRIDPQGNALTFYYSDTENPYETVLKYVVDATGLTNTLDWGADLYGYPLLTNVVDAYQRSMSLQYDENDMLTNITDVGGLSSTIWYDNNGWPTNLTTPYGTTVFSSLLDVSGEDYQRAWLITDPGGGQHLYYFSQDQTWLTYPSASIPTNTPLGTLDTLTTDTRNSYYWGPRQYPLLPQAFRDSPDFSTLTTNEYKLARLRHWLGGVTYYGDGTHSVEPIDTLALEQEPSPDGTALGQVTWYDYTDKPAAEWQGSQILPAVTARVMPDGSTWYKYDERDSWGHITNEIRKWVEGGADFFATNTYVYTNGFDIILAVDPDGVTNAANGYDAHHRILFETNALHEVTAFKYNSREQLIRIVQPSGLIITNIYDSDGFLTSTYSYANINGSTVHYGTNIYTYANGEVRTHTGEHGLTVTNTWDALERLRHVDYPDGTFITNSYDKLDLVRVVDRMGFTNSFGYDNMRRRTAVTNAIGRYTLYDYCTCGSLDTIQDAAGNYTYFYYDNQGRPTNVVYADGYALTNHYDLLGQLTNRIDSGGTSVTNWFDNRGLLIAISNAFGQVRGMAYDVEDRLTNSVDANGVSVSMAYDELGRLLTRTYPDGGVEHFGYTSNVIDLTSYTNQTGSNVVLYAYDPAARKTNEVYWGVTTNQFGYNWAGDLTKLTDGKDHDTTWGYDIYGRVTNKWDDSGNSLFAYQYDPDSRLTNRLSRAKGTTVYRYDPVGNLTNVDYSGGSNATHSLYFSYDALNRLTNMVDGVGTTVYGYDAAGQLLSEDGPWDDDSVSYTYNNRLRTSLRIDAPNASAWSQTYAYDAARRMTNVTSPAGAFGYLYLGSRPSTLVSRLSLPNGAYITNTYDSVARLLSTFLKNSANSVLNSHSYGYNAANERTQQVFTAGNYVNYTYDGMGQLKTALGKESGGVTNRLQEQLGYAYDAAGNLNYRTNNALVQTFAVNDLNELTTVSRASTFTVVGTTTGPATNVTVSANGGAAADATLYTDNTFAKGGISLLSGDNSFTAVAKDSYGRVDSNTVTAYLPSSATYSYDGNGNLTNDGRRVFFYDDENQLVTLLVSNAWRSDFVYDGKLRCRIETNSTWHGGAWLATNVVRYVYDGNVPIQHRDGNNLPTLTLTRGLDLSGSLQGAGGIGGILAMTENAAASPEHTYFHADGNGNVTCLIDTNQLIVAKYEYDPYGNTLSISGPKASVDRYRFSSKLYDPNSGLVYFLYRLYDPNLQRWPNWDPLNELGHHLLREGSLSGSILYRQGGLNPYIFAFNSPAGNVDGSGLLPWISIIQMLSPPSAGGYVCPKCKLTGIILYNSPQGKPVDKSCHYDCSYGSRDGFEVDVDVHPDKPCPNAQDIANGYAISS